MQKSIAVKLLCIGLILSAYFGSTMVVVPQTFSQNTSGEIKNTWPSGDTGGSQKPYARLCGDEGGSAKPFGNQTGS